MRDKKAYDKARYKANKEKILARHKVWYAKNKEKHRAITKAYYEANKEEINAYNKDFYNANKEKILAQRKVYREANKEKRKAQVKAWEEANRDKVNAKLAKRRASKLNRTPGWLTEEDLGKIKEFYKEAQKRKEETGEEWHVDHIIPLQGENISGLHVPDNLQVIRAKDNLSKANRYTI